MPRVIVPLILLLTLLLAVGVSIYAWTLRPPAEDSADVRFARDMLVHHEQAVELALLLRERSQTPELRAFALDILLTQQAQAGMFQGWLQSWGQPLTGAYPPMFGMQPQMGMATSKQIAALRVAPPQTAEMLFLTLMIRHHEGGVYMAEAASANAHRPEVRQLAAAIIAGQQPEIAYMHSLLRDRGVPIPAPLPRMDHTQVQQP